MRFVLVHGGYHGAWCWDKLVPELEALGHEVLAIDLPGAGERVAEKATIATWRAAVAEVLEDGDILVGHSMGGYVIALGVDEAPEKVARVIFLSAAVPVDGESMVGAATKVNEAWAETTGKSFADFTRVVDVPGQGLCIELTDPEVANTVFYHDCSPDDQAWAFERLTPLPVEVVTEPFSVPRFWTSPAPRDFIVCMDDRSHPITDDNEFMRRLGLNTSMGIISSHSAFLSRPADTARLLDSCARGALN